MLVGGRKLCVCVCVGGGIFTRVGVNFICPLAVVNFVLTWLFQMSTQPTSFVQPSILSPISADAVSGTCRE